MKTFYDPHPGMLGAAAPLPEYVRIVAESLDGTTCEIKEVFEMIRDAIQVSLGSTEYEIKASEDCILLKVWENGRGNYPVHCWRVLRFV